MPEIVHANHIKKLENRIIKLNSMSPNPRKDEPKLNITTKIICAERIIL